MRNDVNKKIYASAMMFTLVAVLFFPVIHSQENRANALPLDNTNWWNTTWPYRKLISINHTKVASDLTDFTVLIHMCSDTDLAARAQDDGDDIAFVLYSDNTTQLDHEIELFNGTTGRTVAWANVPSLSSTIDTKIWLYYGNSICPSQQNVNSTWNSDYLSVHHLNETGTTMYDSTGYNNNGISTGTNFTATGKIDGGQLYNGNDKIVVNNFTHSPKALTIEGWVYRDSTAFIYIACKGTYSSTNDWILYLRNNQSANQGIDFSIKNHTSYIRKGDTPVNCWFYLTASYNNGSAALYFNATQIGTGTGWPSIPNSYPHLGLGNDYLGTEGGQYPMTNVKLDEFRVSKIARNSGWITTCYNNQNDPGSFYSIGAEQQYEYTLMTTSDPPEGGTIIASPTPPYHYNNVVTLNATANPGYTFSNWSGNLTGNQNPATLLIDGNKSVTASFIVENNPPFAVNDSATVFENSSNNSLDVLANDYDPDGDNLTITSVTQPFHGVSSQDGSSVYYTPLASYTGSDSFTYNISDGLGGNASATVFITVIPVNNPPYIPSHPVPDNGDTNVSITTDLGWSGGDPDPDDIVRYDVYFGTTSPPLLVSSNHSTSTYDPGILANDTTYYWRIISWDTHNASTEGVVWHFSTQQEEGGIVVNITRPLHNSFYLRNMRLFKLPRTTVVYGPITIKAKVTADVKVKRVEFYIDGKLKKIDIMPPYTYHWAPLRSFKHVIKVQAYDINGHTASDELTVFKWRLHPLMLMGGALLLTSAGK